MAAPTNVFVESNSITTATLNWDYAGSNAIGVYRALHGGAFSLIDSLVLVLLTYADITVSPGVWYDYKLSDDAGATFSSVVSVVIQACPSTAGSNQSANASSLPQFTSENDVNAKALQELATKVEASLNSQVMNPSDCQVCPTNGAVVIDCSSGCVNFTVVADQDINSITITQCNDGTISIVVPPNTTRRICGFPAGFGFTGQECRHATINGGATGRTLGVGMGRG